MHLTKLFIMQITEVKLQIYIENNINSAYSTEYNFSP